MIDFSLKINGEDKTNRVQYLSLFIRDNINQRRDTCSFNVKKTTSDTFFPKINDEVIVLDGTERIFGGIITLLDVSVESINLLNYKVTTVDFSYLLDRRVVLERFRGKTVSFIIDFLLDKYDTEGFTMNNVSGSQVINSITFNRIKFSECLEKLAELTGFSWYVDYNKDIHFFSKNEIVAPFELTDTSNNFVWDSLNLSNDLSQMRNAVFIEGGEEIGNEVNEDFTAEGNDAERTYYRLAHKFSSRPVVVANNIVMDVGIENLDDDANFDCMWSFGEKYIRFTLGNIPTVTHVVSVTGTPLFPIIVRVQSPTSIAEFGLKEFVIRDKTIQSKDEAKSRATAELTAYQKGLQEASFRTYSKGLRSGQRITINSPLRGINEKYLIQSVAFKMIDNQSGIWSVTLATLRTVGIIDFLQGLMRDRSISENENETLLSFIDFQDGIQVDDNIVSIESQTGPYIWLSGDPSEDAAILAANPGSRAIVYNFFTWGA
jgi:hypothetical protein